MYRRQAVEAPCPRGGALLQPHPIRSTRRPYSTMEHRANVGEGTNWRAHRGGDRPRSPLPTCPPRHASLAAAQGVAIDHHLAASPPLEARSSRPACGEEHSQHALGLYVSPTVRHFGGSYRYACLPFATQSIRFVGLTRRGGSRQCDLDRVTHCRSAPVC